MQIAVLIITMMILLVAIFLAAMILSRKNELQSVEKTLRDEMSQSRQELTQNLDVFTKQLLQLTQMNEQKLEKVREVVEQKLRYLQEDNSVKLERIRETVDEKLHSTLEKRLGESFQMVSERLEKVHEGLGEMQNLATGVGDLKKVLANVKTRGTWGEIQLENLLEQILTSDQYAKNVTTKKGSRDSVEFAIKLPGKDEEVVYIPIDAKFPKEDYERLLQAQDDGNVEQIEASLKGIEARIKLEAAKKIRDKYIDPPGTTEFAILYLPIEGLYAEVLRRPGLCDQVQREYRVTISGPTTITAVLNSLQMGFRTLAVQKRASEVWNLLGKVKSEFGKFGDILTKTHDRLQQASSEIEKATRKTRTIEQTLKKVQDLPEQPRKAALTDEVEALTSDDQLDNVSV